MINNNKLIIRDNRGCSIIEFSKIVYFQGKGMYTEIYFNDSRFIISKNIKCIEDKLPDYIFVRIHQ